ncbi:MAG: CBS domain-containing protein [Deltaproteobacteria bacterium]|nr:CBS domain-containing protein [Deltaproteobacteria bacterium]
MPLTRKVTDLLVPIGDYAVTNEDSPLSEAILALRKVYCQVEVGKCTEAGHRNILVLDSRKHLVGILDFRTILRALIPEIAGGLTQRLEAIGVSVAFAQADSLDLDESRLSFQARVIKNADTKVKHLMLKVRGLIQAQEDLLSALKLMYANNITVLPVYENGDLIGVLRESDLFLTVADIVSN